MVVLKRSASAGRIHFVHETGLNSLYMGAPAASDLPIALPYHDSASAAVESILTWAFHVESRRGTQDQR